MVDTALLAAHADTVLLDAAIAELPNRSSGKVRESYDLPDGRRILITTDRLSAFDRILTAVPFKGECLTQIARFWFEKTADICPNYVIEFPDPNVTVGRRLAMLPVEIVVRGYLAGTTGTSILTLYKRGQRAMYGHRFPEGLRDNQTLPAAILTPTTKGEEHDEPLSGDDILKRGLLTQAQWAEVSRAALALFARGQEIAAARGLILVDTKYEFGLAPDGRITLGDEIHTPDSSRYWYVEGYESAFAAGKPPPSLDKDVVRRWVSARCDPYKDAIPPIPKEVVAEASAAYIEVAERMTGQSFALPPPGTDVLARIRKNLQRYSK
jgi:phosphoribosylaminoimidazole-succinocarboxamide synthase